MADAQDWAELLRWYVEMGVDETIGELPVDRTQPRPAQRAAPAAIENAAQPPARAAMAPAVPRRAVPAPSALPAAVAAPDVIALANAAATLDALERAVAAFEGCALRQTATNSVFADGNPAARLMLIGEAPGAEEDRLGEPFVGQAGKLLDNMLAAIGLSRGENVYIANVLKCRPPGNRNPEPEEVAKCTPFLKQQIALVRPKLILAMGRFAAQTLLASDATIASMRGRVFRYEGVPLIVTYHPAYLLRTLPDKAKAWEDLVFARKTMQSL